MSSWWKYSRDLALAGFEAQSVIALRTLKLAAGGPKAAAEAHRMFAEKWTAAAEAAVILASGGSAPKVLNHHRAIMRSNRRRLGRSKR